MTSSVDANRSLYDGSFDYSAVAPHLAHPELRELHDRLLTRIYERAREYSAAPRVLDLGAGDGISTELLLRLGARVTAVDLSEPQLSNLRARCVQYADRLEIRCADVLEVVREPGAFDVVVLNSFLHHIPDYLGLIDAAIARLVDCGQVFTFQDPLRYDTLSRTNYAASQGAYFMWRVLQGNLLQGLRTRVRRLRGVYVAGSKEDDAEYHVTRNGVDQDAIVQLLNERGFAADVIRYFSTQSPILQRVGVRVGLANTFGIVATRGATSR